MMLHIRDRLKQLKYYVNMGLILTWQIKLVGIVLFCCLIYLKFLCEFHVKILFLLILML